MISSTKDISLLHLGHEAGDWEYSCKLWRYTPRWETIWKLCAVIVSPWWASLVAQLVKNPPAMQETLVLFLSREDPLKKGWTTLTPVFLGFPGGSSGKESACNAGDLGSIPGLRRSPGGGHGNPLAVGSSCLENPHGQRNLVGYNPWGCKESDMTEGLNTAQHSTQSVPGSETEQDPVGPSLVQTSIFSTMLAKWIFTLSCRQMTPYILE